MKPLLRSNFVLSFAFLIFMSIAAEGTTVTGTLVDPTGQALINSTVTAEFAPAPGTTGSPTIPSVTFVTDNNGGFTITLIGNDTISPAKSTYSFTICPNATTQCFIVKQVTIVGTTQNISTILNTGIQALNITPQNIVPKAYKDSEILTTDLLNSGALYWNTVQKGLRFWNGSNWSNVNNLNFPSNCNLVFDGNSITAGTGASVIGVTDWPSQFMTMSWAANRGNIKSNVAVGGTTTADAITRYNTSVHPLSPVVTGKCGYYFLLDGHNDLSGSALPASSIIPNLETLWSTAKTDGFIVIAMTIKRATVLTGTKETERVNLNKLIRLSSTWDVLIPMDAIITDPTDNTYMFDGTHPNDNGYNIMAKAINSILNNGGKIWFGASEIFPNANTVSAGSPAAGMLAGDLSTARNATQGVLFIGSDGTVFLFRNGAVTTLKNVALAITIDGSSPAGIGAGDLAAVRAANQGTVWFGNDGARIFRNGNIANWSPVGLAVSIDGTVPSSIAQGDISAARSSTTGDIWLGNDSNVRLQRASVTLTNLTNSDWNASPASIHSTSGWLKVSGDTFGTTTNCASAAGTCATASAGSVSIAAAATTVTVSTTAITANSQIFVQEDSSLGARLGVTCNTTAGRTYIITARTAATSFVITSSGAPVTNPACLSYHILN